MARPERGGVLAASVVLAVVGAGCQNLQAAGGEETRRTTSTVAEPSAGPVDRPGAPEGLDVGAVPDGLELVTAGWAEPQGDLRVWEARYDNGHDVASGLHRGLVVVAMFSDGPVGSVDGDGAAGPGPARSEADIRGRIGMLTSPGTEIGHQAVVAWNLDDRTRVSVTGFRLDAAEVLEVARHVSLASAS